MIHAYAIEPDLAAVWGKPSDYRYFRDKFGLGTPRILFEIPKFTNWRSKVLRAAEALGVPDMDMERLTALLEILGERRCKRCEACYDGTLEWLVNAECEYDRLPFAAILARGNPRGHKAVVMGPNIGVSMDERWDKPAAAFPARQPEEMANAVAAMLANCCEVRFVDPHFGPDHERHRKVLEAMLKALMVGREAMPQRVEIHCGDKLSLKHFDLEAAKMAVRLPNGLQISFFRWCEKDGGERFHDRYILTDLGGVIVAGGLDDSSEGQTDNINLMPREQYEFRLRQFTRGDTPPFDPVDQPASIIGQESSRRVSRTR